MAHTFWARVLAGWISLGCGQTPVGRATPGRTCGSSSGAKVWFGQSMKILVHGRFYPSIGGIETVLQLLATHWHGAGESVVVATDVGFPQSGLQRFPFVVQSQPGPCQWVRLMRWADIFVHINLGLKALWPRSLRPGRPFVVVSQGFYYSDSIRGLRSWRERLKLRLLQGAINVAASQSIASRLPVKSKVIPNPFDDSIFQRKENGLRQRDLIFVGRLVSEKGAELLLRALSKLEEPGLRPELTVVGDGPERKSLESLSSSLGLSGRVVFTGFCTAKQVASLLRRHAILVVPSISEEPFGVVALEGAACGCVVLGSNGGGLPEAIGPTGLTFQRGDVCDLTAKLAYLLLHKNDWANYRQAINAHLQRHRPKVAAEQYLSIFRQALSSDS